MEAVLLALAVVVLSPVVGFAAWRTACMLHHEDGPFDLFSGIRGWVFSRFDEGHWVARGFDCIGCLSFWSSLLASLLALPMGLPPAVVPLLWFGGAGVAYLLHLLITSKDAHQAL